MILELDVIYVIKTNIYIYIFSSVHLLWALLPPKNGRLNREHEVSTLCESSRFAGYPI